jgi:hypothetical protein
MYGVPLFSPFAALGNAARNIMVEAEKAPIAACCVNMLSVKMDVIMFCLIFHWMLGWRAVNDRDVTLIGLLHETGMLGAVQCRTKGCEI